MHFIGHRFINCRLMHGNKYQKNGYCSHMYCIYWHNSNCGVTAKTVA